MKIVFRAVGCFILLLLLGACASPLSKDALYGVNHEVDYDRLKADPGAYLGKTLILGGVIVENRVSREGSVLEILKYTLGKRDDPIEPDEGNGRFLAASDRILDPALYRAGRKVTLTGTLAGRESRPLGEASYEYPVFRIGEIYLWPIPHPYDPYYDTYPYRHRYPYWGW